MTRKSPCVDPSHTRKAGTRRCLTCANVRQRMRRAVQHAARGETLLIPEGQTAHQAGALRMWAQRRQTYGPSGARPEAVARNAARASTLAQRRKRPAVCRHGHALTAATTILRPDGRRCRVCLAQARQRRAMARRGPDYRPAWAETASGRVNVAVHDVYCQTTGARLWADIRAAHPDAGGTAARFREARKRWERFMAQEAAWYGRAGVPMPDVKRPSVTRREAA